MHLLSRAHYGYYCLISGSSKTSSTLSKRRVKMSHGAKRRETECLLDIGVRYPKDIPSPLCSIGHPTVRQKHIKSMLENIHKNADAFNTFRVRMREKELDWSADQYISRWISMIVYFHRRFLPLSSPLPRPRPFCPMF